MPLYNRQFIEELNGLSIETVAVKLGLKVMKHRSLCPWHSDHTPSLTYNIQTKKNYCHCFVCGKGGGPITLTMQVENCSFPDACKILAKEFSIPLPNNQKNTIKLKKKEEGVAIEKKPQSKEADTEVLNWVIEHTRMSRISL